VSSAPLFGRDPELAQLRAALERTRRRETVIAHVRGTSGAGKSALVERFLDEPDLTRRSDVLVLRSRCFEREAMPFKALDGVMDALVYDLMQLDDFDVAHVLPQDVGELAQVFPVFERLPAMLKLTGGQKIIGEAAEIRRRAENSVSQLIERLTMRRTVVIWIDDLQWGDLDSASVIKNWLNQRDGAPLSQCKRRFPALEKTLEVYERRGRPREECLRLRSSLVVAGYLSDYRVVRRYGSETLAMLSESSGMQLANRLRKYLGGGVALMVAVLVTALRRPWLPRERRGPPVHIAIQYFVRCAMGLIGVRATGLDGPGTQEILRQVAPLEFASRYTAGPLTQAAALRVRMLYYMRRGDGERAERCRYLIDLHAIQSGHAWQVEWFVSPAEGMAGAAWSDMLMIRRGLERMERLVEEVPSLAPARDSTRMAYAFRRGEFARAAELGERYIAEHAPRTVIGWGPAYAIIAMAFIETGRAAEAKVL
jgi:hypothetical protein